MMGRRGMAWRGAWAGLALLAALGLGGAGDAATRAERAGDGPMTAPARGAGAGPLTADSSLGELLRHPALAGFGRLLLPWDDRAYDDGMPLRSIGALLPYHSQVHTGDVLAGLNRLIADASRGQTVFYEFYQEGQKREEPARANTGLFFFRGNPGAPFAVIAPGGGFAYVGSVHEGFPHAAAISARGYNAFVLRYRTGSGGAIATQDLAAALSHLFRQAGALGVGTDGYSLWGSSAGARMAAAIGSHGAAAFGGDALPRPSAVVMAYTGHADLGAQEPPTFVVVGERDGISPPSAMERRVAALRQAGAPVEYRKFPEVGHGFGLGTGTSAEGWIEEAIRFWARFLPRRP